jgi:small-conductance mechanosensitive channel
MNYQELLEQAEAYGLRLLDALINPEIGFQLGVILLLYFIAGGSGRRVRPMLDERADALVAYPHVKRVVDAFIERIKWLVFAALLLIAQSATAVAPWPASNALIHTAMLLSTAWVVISVVSSVIRSKALAKAFSVIAWIFVAASILGVTGQIADLLRGAGFSIGQARIDVLTLLQATIVFAVLVYAATVAGNFLDRRIQGVNELTPSLRVLIGKVLRISLIVFAALIAMSSFGIDLTALTVFSGAVGVGLGFGLQKVVSNFISGIIILLDQSIKPGDTISLGDTFGWIRELRARFVSVVTRDGREFLIPNEDLITTQVINWSFSDKFVRLDVPFGVSYDSDPHEVSRVAIEAAGSVDRVDSSRKPPVCWMTEFGDSSINFKLRFWFHDPQQGLTNIRGRVLLALWDAFKENDIKIPYPHREVIMKTPVQVETPDEPLPND